MNSKRGQVKRKLGHEVYRHRYHISPSTASAGWVPRLWSSKGRKLDLHCISLSLVVFQPDQRVRLSWWLPRSMYLRIALSLKIMIKKTPPEDNASVNSTCAKPPAPATAGHLPALSVPGVGAFANVALPGGRAFANPRANPELLTRTRFPIRI